MKPRKINIKNGEMVEICINGVAAIVCLRSDGDESLFVNHNSTDTHSIDWTGRAYSKIESMKDAE